MHEFIKIMDISIFMDSFGREDRQDFETLQDLVAYLDKECYTRWGISFGTHSDEVTETYVAFLEVIKQTEEGVRRLDEVEPGLRMIRDADYEIGMAYRNGINQALRYLVELEERILREPSKVEI